jgi:hypothetical protein
MTVVPQIVAGLTLALGISAAQTPTPPPFTRPVTEAEEIALALSALPESMRATAAVHVLGPKGYRRVREGTSGVNCLVERERPDTQEPICWDAEGSDTIMPIAYARAEWRIAGLTEAAIAERVRNGFGTGRFRAPRRAGVAYMLSAQNFVFDGQKVIHYVPHVMFYAPYLTSKDIGSPGKDANVPWILHEGSPHAYLMIVTPR